MQECYRKVALLQVAPALEDPILRTILLHLEGKVHNLGRGLGHIGADFVAASIHLLDLLVSSANTKA